MGKEKSIPQESQCRGHTVDGLLDHDIHLMACISSPFPKTHSPNRGDPRSSEWTACVLDLPCSTIHEGVLSARGMDRKDKFSIAGSLKEDEETGICLFQGTKDGWGTMDCRAILDGDGIIGRWQWGLNWYF